MKFSIKELLSKCDQIRKKLRIWLHLLKKSLMENFFSRAVILCKIVKTRRKLGNIKRMNVIEKFINAPKSTTDFLLARQIVKTYVRRFSSKYEKKVCSYLRIVLHLLFLIYFFCSVRCLLC